MEHARAEYEASERHACRLLGQWRRTQRYAAIGKIDEEALTEAIIALKTVEDLLLTRTGLPRTSPGTLNVTIPFDYIVRADTTIEPHEYFSRERLKLQRCRVRGHRMIIMRPEPHEESGGIGANVLELVSPLHLRTIWGLVDGDQLDVEVEGDDEWWGRADPGTDA